MYNMNQSEESVLEGRLNPRVKENRLLAWETQNGNIQGRARVKNISLNGMMIETTSDFEPYSNCVFSFDADLGHDNYIPQSGRLVWHRTDEKRPGKKLCGIQFIDRTDFITERLEKRIEKFFHKKSTYKTVTVVADAMGSLVLVALVGFVIWTCYEIYYNLQSSHQQLTGIASDQVELTQRNYKLGKQLGIQRSQTLSIQNELFTSQELSLQRAGEIDTISGQLAETRQILAQTQVLLDQAGAKNVEYQTSQAQLQATNSQLKYQNNKLQSDLTALQKDMKERQSEFEEALIILEGKNQELVEEMRVLDKQLAYYAGNINSIEEGERWFDMYSQRVKTVKLKIKHFKRQARETRNAALKERDRIQMVLGNNGYFMKDGQQVKVDMEKYNNVSLENISNTKSASTTSNKPRVEIDVNFYR